MNKEIKNYAIEKNVYLWEIADKLGITDSSFSRKLRKEFSNELKEKIISIIDEISQNRKEL